MKDEVEISRDFKGIWIERALWLNQNLTPLQKMLIAEIDSLSKSEQGCIASNEYLAKFFAVTTGRMAHMIAELRKMGHIETVSFDGRTRQLRSKAVLSESSKAESSQDVGIQQGSVAESRPAYIEERKGDNKERKKSFSIPSELQGQTGIAEILEAFNDHRKKIKKPMSEHAKHLILKKLSKRPTDAVEALEMAIEAGWAGFEWEWFDKRKPEKKTFTPARCGY